MAVSQNLKQAYYFTCMESIGIKRGRPPKKDHKISSNVHCCFGLCRSDSRPKYSKDNVGFIPFPKPCLFYRKGQVEDECSHIKQCDSCKKCDRWIKLGRRKDEHFSSIAHVTRNSYICTLHFIDGEPTDENPDPISASVSPEQVEKLKQRKQVTSKKTVLINDCKRRKLTSNQTENPVFIVNVSLDTTTSIEKEDITSVVSEKSVEKSSQNLIKPEETNEKH